MRKLQVGDVVNMHDGSYCFGTQYNSFTKECDCRNGDRKGLVIIGTGLNVMDLDEERFTPDNITCNTLVTNRKGGFWFTQERFVKLVTPVRHTISVDGGKEVELSDESYQNITNQIGKQ